MKTIEVYREFDIHEYYLPQFSKYAYSHKDYDGEDDHRGRAGYADTIEECKAEIDEYWEGLE